MLSPRRIVRNLSNHFLLPLALTVSALAPAEPASAQEPFTMETGLYIQPQFHWEDPDDDTSESTFLVRRARVSVRGNAYENFTYLLQMDVAGSSARLIDAVVSRPINSYLTVSVGQAKAPFGRQQLTSDTGLQFVDRGILDPRFNPARQPGVWVSGGVGDGLVQYSAGVFNGDGINRANDDGDYLKAARVVWNPLGPYALEESSLDFPESPRLALGAGFVDTKFDPTDPFDAHRLGLEAAFKVGGFSAVSEYVHERLSSPTRGRRRMNAWYAQSGFVVRPGYEAAVRYGTISPSTADATTPDLTEKGVSVSRYFEGHDAKIQADFLRIESDVLPPSVGQIRVQVQLRL